MSNNLPILTMYAPYPTRKDTLRKVSDIAQIGFDVQCRGLEQHPNPDSLAVIVMRTALTDSQVKEVKNRAATANLKMITLPEQQSSWAEILKALLPSTTPAPEPPPSPANPPKVSTEKMDAFLRMVQAGLKGGLTWAQLVPNIRPYWRAGGPSGPAELQDYVERLTQTPERCPVFFREWWAEYSRPQALPPPSSPSAPVPVEVVDLPPVAPPIKVEDTSEYKSLVELYEELERANVGLTMELKRVNEQAVKTQDALLHCQAHNREEAEKMGNLERENRSLRNQVKEGADMLQDQLMASAEAQEQLQEQINKLQEELKAKAKVKAPASPPPSALVSVFSKSQAQAVRSMLQEGYSASDLLEQVLKKIGV